MSSNQIYNKPPFIRNEPIKKEYQPKSISNKNVETSPPTQITKLNSPPTQITKINSPPSTPVSGLIITKVQQTIQEEQKWLDGLRDYLYNELLPKATVNEKLRKLLVSGDTLTLWMSAFTHESYDPNIGKNYEEFEKLGDSVMKSNFYRFIMARYNNLNKMQISQLGNYYVSKPVQANLANRFGLVNWLRSGGQIDTHMAEDILESVFGALMIISDKVSPMGTGYVLCYNLLIELYQSIKIDLVHARDPPKTEVKNIFDKLKFGSVREIWYEGEGKSGFIGTGGTMEILYPVRIRDFILDNFKFDIVNTVDKSHSYVLAQAEGNTKKIASNNVYKNALLNLNKIGLTLKWVEENTSESDYETNDEYKNSELKPYYLKALSKAKENDFTNLYFSKPKKGSSGCYIQLIGEQQPSGFKEVLRSISVCPAITTDIKQEMLTSYANS